MKVFSQHTLIVASLCSLLLSACADSGGNTRDYQFQPPPTVDNEVTFAYHWQRLVDEFVSEDGRVIDLGSEGSISTSEGQSYGMFFALVANDQATFQRLLQWTENNLAPAGLDAQLPAWQWGHNEETDRWGILDSNPATDADVWMAFSLLEAGRLWDRADYRELGGLLASRILRESVKEVGDETVLLPAPYGFVKSDRVTLNPSYFSLSVFAGLAHILDDERWQTIYDSSLRQLSANADAFDGFFSDWVSIDYDLNVINQDALHGSYDAIRTYLWLHLDATRSNASPEVQVLLDKTQPLVDYIEQQQTPPEHIYPNGQTSGTGPIGFSIALAPYLSRFDPELESLQYQRLLARGAAGYDQRYYDSMLILFGLAAQQCFGFSNNGTLEVNWHAENC